VHVSDFWSCSYFEVFGEVFDIVLNSPVKPRIDRTNLKRTVVKVGKPIKLDVNVKGEPPPRIKWLLKDTEARK